MNKEEKKAALEATKAEVESAYVTIWGAQEAILQAELAAAHHVKALIELAPNAVFRFGERRVVFSKRRDGAYNCRPFETNEV